MNKLKNVFQRSQKLTEERRPHQFIKRHSSAVPSFDAPLEQHNAPPAISLSELSEMERPFFQSCWKDLDPFGHDRISNQTVLKFLSGCTLEDAKLEKILALFETARDGLNQLQFFAMLRLIAHAQNGRKISKALVYLGAPVPQFHANAIDALIKSDIAPLDSKESSEKSPWWQNNQQQTMSNNRRSYGGPFASYNATPKAQTQLNYFYTPNADDIWKATPSAPPLFHQPSTSTHKSEHSHSRSKSAGNAASYLQPVDTQGQLHSSRSSLSLHELNNASSSLLLTQKFVYQSPSLRKQELPSKNNPFYSIISEICSPFDDEYHSGTIEAAVESNYIPFHDDKPNANSTLPLPVPNQATKPLFPKYAKNT